MEGSKDENERQLQAAPSSSTPTTPINDTDDYIHQMMVRLSPNETVVRRIRPGKFKFRYILLINTF